MDSATTQRKLGLRLWAKQPTNLQKQSSDSKFVRYRASRRSASFNSGVKERIVRVVEMAVDVLEPPKFKHRRIPRASGSPPPPVLQSPPPPVTVKELQDWKIPPCVSNWKNQKGYTMLLHNRLAADGGGLQEVRISDNFPRLSEALHVAERKAREDVAMRSMVEREKVMREKEKRDMELRDLAKRARFENACVRDVIVGRREEREERLNMGRIREERREERKRERMMEANDGGMGRKSKISRDRGRDVSERVALGMATTGGREREGEVMYDQRLFNQEKGMDSGFAIDDAYNIYDNRMFFAQSAMNTLFKPKRDG